jgi:hypothetical protein
MNLNDCEIVSAALSPILDVGSGKNLSPRNFLAGDRSSARPRLGFPRAFAREAWIE